LGLVDRRQYQRQRERDAAVCVAAAVDGMSLHEMRESPDADLVHEDGFHVGLEIVRTEDPRPLHLKKRMEACSASLHKVFASAGLTGLFQPYYDVAAMSRSMERSRKRAWDREVPSRLAQLVATRGAISLDAETLAAHQISGIVHIEAEPADHTFVGVGWRTS